MPDRKQLLKDFYSKYAPNEQLTEERIAAIDAKYGEDNDRLISDIYSKYAPNEELSEERLDVLYSKYGLKKKEQTIQGGGVPSRTMPQPSTSQSGQVSPRVTPLSASSSASEVSPSTSNLSASTEVVSSSTGGGETPLMLQKQPQPYQEPTIKPFGGKSIEQVVSDTPKQKSKITPYDDFLASLKEEKKQSNDFEKPKQIVDPSSGLGIGTKIKSDILATEKQERYLQQYFPEIADKASKERQQYEELKKEAKGSVPGALWNSIAQSYTKTVSDMSELILGAFDYTMRMVNDDYRKDAEIREEISGVKNLEQITNFSSDIKEILDDKIKSKATNDEFAELLKKDSYFWQGTLGLGESVYPMITPGMSGFFATGTVDGMKELQELNPNATEEERFLYGAAQGAVMMSLERFGLSNLVAKNPYAKKLVSKVAGEVVGELVKKGEKVVGKTIMETANTLVSGYASEFETGALQEVGEEIVKQTYDLVSGEDNFENKVKSVTDIDGLKSFIGDVIIAGHLEGIGGGLMGSIKASADVIVSPSKRTQAKDYVSKIETIENELNKPNITEQARVQLNEKLKSYSDSLLEMVYEDSNTLSKMPQEVKDKVNSLSDEIEKNKQVISDPSVSDEVKEIINQDTELKAQELEEIVSEFEAVEEEKPTEEQAEVPQPEIIKEEGKDTEYKDSEGRFYSEQEIIKLAGENKLEGFTITNPSQAVEESITPKAEEKTQEQETETTKQEEVKTEPTQESEEEFTEEQERDDAYDLQELYIKKQEIESSQEAVYNDDIKEVVIARAMPKINPESAAKETGGDVGTNRDVNIGLVSKNGVSVEQAADIIKENNFSGDDSIDGPEIRDIIIEILKTGKKQYIAQFTKEGNLKEIDSKIKEIEARVEQRQQAKRKKEDPRAFRKEQFKKKKEEKERKKQDKEGKKEDDSFGPIDDSPIPFQAYSEKELETASKDEPSAKKKRTLKSALAVTKALKKVAPGMKVVVHNNQESYGKAVVEAGGREADASTRGFYLDKSNTIHVNSEMEAENTIFHEGAHPLIEAIAKDNPEAITKLHTELKSLKGVKGVKEVLKWADNNYTPQQAKKEAVVEFLSRVATGEISLKDVPKASLDKIMDMINELLEMIGFANYKINSTSDIQEIAKKFKSALDAGKAIDVVGAETTGEAQFQGSLDGKPATFKRLPESILIVDGWYSPIEKRLRETKAEKQSANKWLTGGFIGKGDEAVYTGVKGWLESKNPQEQVSKQEILDWMKDNRVEIVEVVKGDRTTRLSKDDFRVNGNEKGIVAEGGGYRIEKSEDTNRAQPYDLYFGDEYIQENKSIDDAIERAIRDSRNKKATPSSSVKFSQYQLEGEKENYKEVLVALPRKPKDLYMSVAKKGRKANGDVYDYYSVVRIDDPSQKGSNEVFYNIDDANKKAKVLNANTANQIYEDKAVFKSSHFDEPNILVHLRMNTRTDVDGNKVLFLEEVQSDWGQKGKREGFATPESSNRIKEINARLIDIANDISAGKVKKGDVVEEQSELIKERDRLQKSERTPTAPFVTDTNSWVKLGLKTALKEAVAQGADKIAWTTGEQQNERYDLSKQVNKIDVEAIEEAEGVYFVDIELSSGNNENLEVENGIIREGNYKGQRLEDVIGKEYAEKILSTPKGESVTLQGEDLKLGGKGMKGFYDNIVPSVAKAVVKELTGKEGVVGETKIETQKQDVRFDSQGNLDISEAPQDLLDLFDKHEEGIIDGSYEALSELQKDAREIGYELDYSLDGDITSFRRVSGKPITTTQQSIEITPELKASVEEGMPMFQKGVPKEVNKFLNDIESAGERDLYNEDTLTEDLVDVFGIPEQQARQIAENFFEPSKKPEGTKERKFSTRVSDEIRQGLSEDAKNYVPIKNQITLDEANAIIQEKGLDETIEMVKDDSNPMTLASRVVMGQALVKVLEVKGEINKAVDVATKLTKLATQVAQGLQAFSIFDKLSASGLIAYFNQDLVNQRNKIRGKRAATYNAVSKATTNAKKSASKQVAKKHSVKLRKPITGFGIPKEQIQKGKEKALNDFKKFFSKQAPGSGQFQRVTALDEKAEEALFDYGFFLFAEGNRDYDAWAQQMKDETGFDNDSDLENIWNQKQNEFGQTLNDLSTASSAEKMIMEHFAKKSATPLSQKLQDSFGLDQPTAVALAKEIEADFEKIAREELEKELKKGLSRSTASKMVSKLDEVVFGDSTDEDIKKLLDEVYGIKEISKETQEKLQELSKKRDARPEGFLQTEITLEMLTLLEKEKGVKFGDMYWALWYASVLSGPETQILNISSNILNGSMETFISAIEQGLVNRNTRAIGAAYSGLLDDLARGGYEAETMLKEGYSPSKVASKLESKGVLETLSPKNPLSYMKYVGRFMGAMDAATSVGIQGMFSRELAAEQAKKEGLKGDAYKDRVAELTGRTEDIVKSAKEQAKLEIQQIESNEGKLPERKKKRMIALRSAEIMDESMPSDLLTTSRDMSKFTSFNYEPRGVVGHAAKMLSRWGTENPLMKKVVPFTTIVANVLNQQIDYTPWGIARYFGGGSGALNKVFGTELNVVAQTQKERNRTLIKGVIGTASLATMAAMVIASREEDEEDPWFDITGKGPSDPNKRGQWFSQGNRPYSIKIGDKRISYQYTPMGVGLSSLGVYLDNARFKELDQKGVATQTTFIAFATVSSILDMSFLTGVTGLIKSVTSNTNPEKIFDEAGKSLVSAPTAFIPNFFKQLDKFIDPTMYQADNYLEMTYNQIPFIRGYVLKPKLNILGEPIEKQGNRFFAVKEKHEIFDLFVKKGYFAPGMDLKNQSYINGNPMSEEDVYEFVKLRGENVKKEIQSSYKYLNSIPKSEEDGYPAFKKELDRIFKFAREDAKWEISEKRKQVE
jgi:hypothetical protein